ncbi:MAG TPA: CPBP family glutamic-type intramembrane protease [Thermoanaerobaculia bacterium]|jgi:hypothetical protein
MDASSRRRAVGEIVAVIATGAIFLVFENLLDLKLPFLAACILGWGFYAGRRLARQPGLLRDWGLRLDTLGPSAAAGAGFFAIVAGAILAWRTWAGWLPVPASAALLFAVYPVWALFQQFFVQTLVAGNLERLGAPRALIVPVAALLFGLAHAPDLPLMALCAGAGVVWTAIYLRWPNLVPISLTHAWLGTLAYLLVLARNPWAEMRLPG